MEYCKQCGAPIDKENGCCVNCGLLAEDYSKKKRKPWIKVIVAVFAAVLVILAAKVAYDIVLSKTGAATDDGYMDVVDGMIDAIYINYNPEKFVGLMPEAVVQNSIDTYYGGDEQAFYEAMSESYETAADDSPVPESVTWNINEEIDLTGTDLKRYNEAYKNEYGVEDNIKYAKGIDISISYTDTNGEKGEDNLYMAIGEIDGKWYLIDYSTY